jgi:hypothetical protein
LAACSRSNTSSSVGSSGVVGAGLPPRASPTADTASLSGHSITWPVRRMTLMCGGSVATQISAKRRKTRSMWKMRQRLLNGQALGRFQGADIMGQVLVRLGERPIHRAGLIHGIGQHRMHEPSAQLQTIEFGQGPAQITAGMQDRPELHRSLKLG